MVVVVVGGRASVGDSTDSGGGGSVESVPDQSVAVTLFKGAMKEAEGSGN